MNQFALRTVQAVDAGLCVFLSVFLLFALLLQLHDYLHNFLNNYEDGVQLITMGKGQCKCLFQVCAE